MIEDNIHYAIELATHGIPTILLDQPWNRDAVIPPEIAIYRVKNWQEIHDLLTHI
jgi:uncharacterized HAD superfamily protein